MWKGLSWLQLAGGAVAGFALAWLIHLVLVAGMERKHAAALTEQRATLERQCADDKRITQEANDDLQQNYAAIARKLADAQRVRPAKCVVPTTHPAVTAASGGEHAGQDATGVSSDWLFEYAAECEAYRGERVILESFIRELYI
jgi:hypothetical protein